MSATQAQLSDFAVRWHRRNNQQALLTIYLVADWLRCDAAPSSDWVRRHGLLTGIVGESRQVAIRLTRMPCLGCGKDSNPKSTGDHIIALSNGGPAGLSNYLPLCGRCNSSKGGRDLLDWWAIKGRSILDLSPDVLVMYARVKFQDCNRLGTFNDPAPPALQDAQHELAQQLPSEARKLLRQRIDWMTGR